jgi:serine/threonine protein kinase
MKRAPPKLSLVIQKSHFEKEIPMLPNEYVTCDDINQKLINITDKYTDTGISLGKGAFKDAMLVQKVGTDEKFVAFDFGYPSSSDDIKEICNFIRIFYRKIDKSIKGCLKGVLCPVDIGFFIKNNKKKVRFITDYFRGVNLQDWLKNHKCEEVNDDLKASVMIKLIDALDELHTKWQYKHHDLKPANIMIDASNKDDPAIAIIDIFGGCFDNQEDCHPMSDDQYIQHLDEVESQGGQVDADIYAMSKIFKDLIGSKWTGDIRGSFECDQRLNKFEQHIYDVSEEMANGRLSLREVKQLLKKN